MSRSDEDASREPTPLIVPSFNRRLWDKILIAFGQACENAELEVAAQLFRVLEMMIARRTVYPARTRHQIRDELVAAQRSLWQVRHPNPGFPAEADQTHQIA